MIHKASLGLANFFCSKGACTKPNVAALVYVFEIWLSKIITFSSLFIILVFLNQYIPSTLLPASIYIVYLIFLRRYTGGYHAKTHLGCYAMTIITTLFSVFVVSPFLNANLIVCAVVGIICFAILLKYSPMIHPKLYCTEMKKTKLRREVKWVIGIEAASILFLYIVGLHALVGYAISGFSTCTIFLLIAWLQNKIKEENDEQQKEE